MLSLILYKYIIINDIDFKADLIYLYEIHIMFNLPLNLAKIKCLFLAWSRWLTSHMDHIIPHINEPHIKLMHELNSCNVYKIVKIVKRKLLKKNAVVSLKGDFPKTFFLISAKDLDLTVRICLNWREWASLIIERWIHNLFDYICPMGKTCWTKKVPVAVFLK